MSKILRMVTMTVILFGGSTGIVFAQEAVSDRELEALRRAAEEEAVRESKSKEETTETTFKSGGLALQALNPEISVTGDLLGVFSPGGHEEEEPHANHHEGEGGIWNFHFRGLGLHFESYLDPYSRFKAAVHAAPPPHGVEIEEGYFTRYGIFGGVNLTLGKFRQQFGIVNRWHKHGLDYVDFPLPLMKIFGHHGLCDTGLSFDWSGSLGGITQEVVLQITGAGNEAMFGGNHGNRPAGLAHYKLYRDISASTYFEIGLSGLVGWNDTWEVEATPPAADDSDVVENCRSAQVYGVDCTLLWEPTDRMRYRNLEWRTELFLADKDIMAPDGSGETTLNPWGFYTSLQNKVSRTIDWGVRYDAYIPSAVDYMLVNEGLFPSDLAAAEAGAYRWLAAVYATWWQSPFVKYRLQVEHEDGVGEPENRVTLQCVFAAGPHKHERY